VGHLSHSNSVEKVGEVTRLGDYLLHTIKSHSTQREQVPHLAHLGHLGHPIAASRYAQWPELSPDMAEAREPGTYYTVLFLLQEFADPFHEGLGIVDVGRDHGIAQDVSLEKAFVKCLPATESATSHVPR
jgi:hypothetical protein